MNKRTFLLISLLMLLSLNLFSTEVIYSEDRVKESAVFEGDYLYLGKELDFSGRADDIYFVGKNLNFDGESRSSVVALGNRIAINGSIDNDFISIGETIDIRGEVDGSIFLAGGTLIIDEGARLNGTIFGGAGEIEINGTVNGDLYLASETLIINGTINGNIKAAGDKVRFGSNGEVNGKITYYSQKLPAGLEGRDNVEFVKKSYIESEDFKMPGKFEVALFFAIAGLITLLLGGFLLLLLPATEGISIGGRDDRAIWFLGLWGLIPTLIYPVALIILAVTVIGIPLALLLLAALFPLAFVAQVIAAVLVGEFIFEKLNWDGGRFKHFLLGAPIILILSLIPVLGCLIELFITAIGWGFIIEKVFAREVV